MNQQWPVVMTAATTAAFEKEYKTMVDQVNALGIEKLIAKYNTQLAEVNSKIDALSKK